MSSGLFSAISDWLDLEGYISTAPCTFLSAALPASWFKTGRRCEHGAKAKEAS